MKEYNQFVEKLKIDLESFTPETKETWFDAATKYVNGLASDELRRLVGIETRRDYGAFFTDSLLATKVINYFKPSFNCDSYIYDPACGAGNLLIASSDYMQRTGVDFNPSVQLLGTDIHQEFVEASKLRLKTNIVLKQTNTLHIDNESGKNLDNSIVIGDGLLKSSFYEKATHIIVNPPFNQVITSEKLSWSKGKVSAAALFIYKIIQNGNAGVSIIAILPDVLRSGTRYEKWRALVQQECIIGRTKLLGQFDKHADVDVYAIELTKRRETKTKKAHTNSQVPAAASNSKILKDEFDICVGPVVDNRDAQKGPSNPYVISRGLKGWTTQNDVALTRRHEGKTFEGPFVVIKRTSRTTDVNRAVATIISIPSPAYVDNHLIVLKPKSGSLMDCRKALTLLKDNRTNKWLNQQIRCRHLTVKIVSKIPIWE